MIRLFDWIPAGVYPDGNRGRNDEIHKLALMPSRGEGEGGGDVILFITFVLVSFFKRMLIFWFIL